ncbi:MAG: hypothetical protein KBT28_08595 [Bacteroidales bacterium]|nr:hypothetical protein [Candidatus Colimorpha merdihippi]
MRKSLSLLLFAVALAGGASAQSNDWKMEWHGFVNPHFYADSRQVVGGREEMMLFYPTEPAYSADSIDVRDGWNMNMLSITARLNLKVTGPDILGAKTFAFIEGDFTGSTNATNNNLRLRHAYLNMDWGNSILLAGQFWHPMVVPEIMPNTRPLNMGAPFHPYARYSQVRFTQKLGMGFDVFAAALFQQDNMSQGLLNGAKTSSTLFLRQSCVPELHLQMRYNSGRLFAGAAATMLTLQPEVWTQEPLALPKNYGDNFSSFSYTLFAKYKWDNSALSVQALLNSNMYEICAMGGYIITHNADGMSEYSPWHFNTVWADYGKTTGKWRPGIFAGYGKNNTFALNPTLGTNQTVLGRGDNIAYLWRVQPRLGYHATDKFNVYAEAEYTFAQYARYTVENGGSSKMWNPDGYGVGNLRLMLSAEYRF